MNRYVKTAAFICLLTALALLAGCRPQRYSEKEERAQIEAARPLMEAYLGASAADGVLETDSLHMSRSILPDEPYGAQYGSTIVSGRFTASGQRGFISADTRSGQVFSDALFPQLKEELQRQLNDYLAACGCSGEAAVESLKLCRSFAFDTVLSPRTGKRAETRLELTNELPGEVSEETLSDYVAGGFGEEECRELTLSWRSEQGEARPDALILEFCTANGGFAREYLAELEESLRTQAEQTNEAGGQSAEVPSPAAEAPHTPATPGPDCPVRIEYDKTAALARWPHFSRENGVVTMRFNGVEWYTVRIITAEARDAFVGEREPLARSANMAAFAADHKRVDDTGYAYVYFMDVDSKGGYCLRFDSDTGPEARDYGNDFTTGIRYYCGDAELIPEIPALD